VLVSKGVRGLVFVTDVYDIFSCIPREREGGRSIGSRQEKRRYGGP
jgi:hypothetical protein